MCLQCGAEPDSCHQNQAERFNIIDKGHVQNEGFFEQKADFFFHWIPFRAKKIWSECTRGPSEDRVVEGYRKTLLLIPWHCSPSCPGNGGHSAWPFALEIFGSWSLTTQTARSAGAARNLLTNQVSEWKLLVSYGCFGKTGPFLQKIH